MAPNPRKRQRKLERKTAKRKEKHHLAAREQSQGLVERLTAATGYPVLHARATEGLWEQGMGSVLLSRVLPDTSVAASVFLVDRFCLGVKNAMTNILTRSNYDDQYQRLMHREFSSRPLTPACVRKLVESAVEYAANLGFPPHPDYHKAKALFGDIDPTECTETFEFGKDGKPFFISGPSDDEARCRRILATLMERCGPGGFHYMIRVDDPSRYIPTSVLEAGGGFHEAGEEGPIEFEEDEDEDED
jgi:hypothetical protein